MEFEKEVVTYNSRVDKLCYIIFAYNYLSSFFLRKIEETRQKHNSLDFRSMPFSSLFTGVIFEKLSFFVPPLEM